MKGLESRVLLVREALHVEARRERSIAVTVGSERAGAVDRECGATEGVSRVRSVHLIAFHLVAKGPYDNAWVAAIALDHITHRNRVRATHVFGAIVAVLVPAHRAKQVK